MMDHFEVFSLQYTAKFCDFFVKISAIISCCVFLSKISVHKKWCKQNYLFVFLTHCNIFLQLVMNIANSNNNENKKNENNQNNNNNNNVET